MGASAYIGRVGALAVALGVGVAVASGQGVAWAGPTEPNSSTSDQPSADADAGQDPDAASDPSTANAPASPPTPEVARETLSSTSTSRANSLLSSLTRAAERGIAVSTGGALTSKKVTSQETVATAEVEEEPEVVVAPEENEPVEKKSSGGFGKKSAESLVRRLSTPTPTFDVRGVDSFADKVDANQAADTVLQRAALAVEQKTFEVKSVMTTVRDAAPVMMAAAEVPTAQPTLPRMLTNLVSVFGLGALASDTPGAPVGTPIVMALLALGVRRESEVAVSTLGRTTTTTTSGTPVAALALTGAPTAAVTATDPATSYVVTPVAVSPNTDRITNVTGPGGLNDTPARFGVGGTDLGIMWDNGIRDDPTTAIRENQVLIAFGDTFTNTSPPRTGVWRNNTLFRSSDNVLNNGMYVRDGSVPIAGTTADDFAGAPLVYNPELNRDIFKQVIANERYAVGPDITIIPTAGVSAPYPNAYGSRQYVNFMSVRSWDSPGRWTTNYSGIAFSDDNGVTWHVAPESIRPAAAGRSTKPFVSGNQNFQQGAFVTGVKTNATTGEPVRDANGQLVGDGYVYSYGTPSGRGGTVYLSRVPQAQILDQTKYQYWNGTTWVTNQPSAAKPILPGTTSRGFFGFGRTTTYPSVGEMSVQYNEYEKKYIMLYTDQNNNVVMRKANTPQGPWSAPTTLVTSTSMPGLYAPMIHPWSGTSNLSAAEQQYLYWNLSTWDDYQVKLMRTDLAKV